MGQTGLRIWYIRSMLRNLTPEMGTVTKGTLLLDDSEEGIGLDSRYKETGDTDGAETEVRWPQPEEANHSYTN